MAERKRREYESLFASNVVLSRRPESERPDAGQSRTTTAAPARRFDGSRSAVDRRHRRRRRAGFDACDRRPGRKHSGAALRLHRRQRARPKNVPGHSVLGIRIRSSDAGPLHRILEGTIIDTVLTNRLDGGAAAPVNCLVTNAVYSHSGRQVLIPAGARMLGETKPVQTFGETRLAVAFHRLLMPDGSTYRLDQFLGAQPDRRRRSADQVNQHYWSTFGAAAAVGLISGLAQALGTVRPRRGRREPDRRHRWRRRRRRLHRQPLRS